MSDLFNLDRFWRTGPGVHAVDCPCGASITTQDKDLAAKFIEAHKGHAGHATPKAPRP